MTDVLIENLRTNNLFAGGFLIMVFGTVAALLFRAVPKLASRLLRRFTVSVEVRDEEVIAWMGDWLGQQEYGARCRRLMAELVNVRPDAGGWSRSVLVFAPAYGIHVLRNSGRWIWVERGFEAEASARRRDYYVLRARGSDSSMLRALVLDAERLHAERKRGKVSIYCVDQHSGWEQLELHECRGLESVVLPAEMMERIVEDLGRFLDNAEWYSDVGVSHRRGYLFFGPPGCGKTSLASALAAHFKMDIYLLGIAGSGMSDERLALELGRTRPRSVILLEDVDAAFTNRDRGADNASRVTFSGLLNAMDGVAAQEHRIFILTTNHVERLDPALIRPGRVDVREFLGYVDGDQAARLFLRFFPGALEEATQVGYFVEGRKVAPAWLQNVLLQHRGDPARALSALREAGAGGIRTPSAADRVQAVGSCL